jgi:hypothetical protein
MISSEVQRTLVKSPPELWAELSDPDALARHLGELGEIRITRTEPENTVEWTAENTTGTVSIKPSGWGTKVTLSVTREIAEPTGEAVAVSEEVAGAEPEATGASEPAEPDASANLEPLSEPTTEEEQIPSPVIEPEPVTTAETAPIEAPVPTAEPTTTPAEPEPEPRRGLFARLFGRRRRAEATESSEATSAPKRSADPPAEQEADTSAPMRSPEQPDAFAAVREALAPETFAIAHPFAALPDVEPAAPKPFEPPAPDARVMQGGDISAELMATEDVAEEEVTAVLTAVLDRLGAAHHRPFSRS